MCICMWYAATARVRSSVERRSSAREREEAEATRELGEATRQPTWRSRRRHMTCVRAPGSFSLPGVPFGGFLCAGHAPRAWQRRAALHAASLAALVLPLRVRVQPGLWVVMELRHLHKLPLPFSSSPSIPLVTCRFGDAYKRRRYSTPPRRRQRVVPSASNAFLGADGSIAALRTMAIAAACAPSIHKPLRPPFGHAGQGWVSAAKYARLPRCGCRQLVRGVRRAVVRLPRLPATLFCTRSALRHWAAYWQTEGRVCLGHGALRRDAGHGVEGPACESLPRRRRRRH